MDVAQKKRGRGRPRKAQVEPEEVCIAPDVGVDLTDLERQAPEICDVPEPANVEEVIRLLGYGIEHVKDPEVQPVEVEAMHVVEPGPPTIVYVPAPVVADPAVEEKKEKDRRSTALVKIKRYRENFEAVRAMKFSEDWSTEALESHLEDVRIMVSSKTTGLLVKSAYIAGVKGIEIVTCKAGMKTYGLSDLLAKNAEVDNILKELQCEMGIGSIPPAHRLALATISTCFVLDSVNKRAEVLGTFKQGAVNADIQTKFKDL